MECNKKICEMQKRSMRVAVDALKNTNDRDTARGILRSILDMLATYNCEITKCLFKRVKTCLKEIYDPLLFNSYLSNFENIQLNMIIQELEEFLSEDS